MRSLLSSTYRVQTQDRFLQAICRKAKVTGLLMCEMCWSEWHIAQPHVAPECSCTRVPCRHFWLHSCYYNSYLERQWSENRQGKSRRRAAIISDVWHLSRDSDLPDRVRWLLHQLIHTTYVNQISISFEISRARSLEPSKTGDGTTQESLSLID